MAKNFTSHVNIDACGRKVGFGCTLEWFLWLFMSL